MMHGQKNIRKSDGVSLSTSTNRVFNYNKWRTTCRRLRKWRPPTTSRDM